MDAGYLLASAATRVTGTSLRKGIHVEFQALIQELVAQAEQLSGLPMLRVHWYDSAKDGVPDTQQERIGELPKVKLRLGRFGVDGQQKGVDLRIGLDLLAHARNRTAAVYILVSGDDDLTEAVEEAQALGVEVVILAVPNADSRPHGVSRHLLRAADELATLAPASIDDHVFRVEKPAPAAPTEPSEKAPTDTPSPKVLAERRPTSTAGNASVLAYSGSTGGSSFLSSGYESPDEHDQEIDAVVTRVVASLLQSATPTDREGLDAERPSIPREIDRALLLDLSESLGVYDLRDPIRFRLRESFWKKFDEMR